MKKIIEGKRFDTKTARSVADNRNDQNEWPGGRGWELFRTPRGAYFLAYWTCWQGESDSIEPVTEAAARKHLEENQVDGDVIEEAFGEAEEAGPDEIAMLAVSRDLRDRLKELAARERRQLRAVVEEAVLAVLDRAEQARKEQGQMIEFRSK